MSLLAALKCLHTSWKSYARTTTDIALWLRSILGAARRTRRRLRPAYQEGIRPGPNPGTLQWGHHEFISNAGYAYVGTDQMTAWGAKILSTREGAYENCFREGEEKHLPGYGMGMGRKFSPSFFAKIRGKANFSCIFFIFTQKFTKFLLF